MHLFLCHAPLQVHQRNPAELRSHRWRSHPQPVSSHPAWPMWARRSYRECGSPTSSLAAEPGCDWSPLAQIPSHISTAVEEFAIWKQRWDDTYSTSSKMLELQCCFDALTTMTTTMYNAFCLTKQIQIDTSVLPSARLVVWLVGKVVSCRWRLVMQTEEPTNNDISMLEQASVAGCTPPGTSQRLNRLHSHPEPQLHTRKPHEEQRQEWGQPQIEEELEKRHGRSFSGCSTQSDKTGAQQTP